MTDPRPVRATPPASRTGSDSPRDVGGRCSGTPSAPDPADDLPIGATISSSSRPVGNPVEREMAERDLNLRIDALRARRRAGGEVPTRSIAEYDPLSNL